MGRPGGGLWGSIEYAADLFERGTVSGLEGSMVRNEGGASHGCEKEREASGEA